MGVESRCCLHGLLTRITAAVGASDSCGSTKLAIIVQTLNFRMIGSQAEYKLRSAPAGRLL